MTATERIRNEITDRNEAFRERLESSPELRSAIAGMSAEERVQFREQAMERYADDTRYRSGTLLEQSGFMKAVNHYSNQFGISDDELETVMASFVKASERFNVEDRATARERIGQNFKDQSLGIGDVGSLSGFFYDEGKFGLEEIADEQQTAQGGLAQLQHVKEIRGNALAGDNQSKTSLGVFTMAFCER